MDIDLNLNNYSTDDLKKLFTVSDDYTIVEVDQKKQLLLDRLIQINVNPQIQRDIVTFLNQAKDALINKSEIITKETTPFIYATPNDYFQGKFNPIEKRLINKTICIDTLFRSNYKYTKATDYTYTFPETINNVVSIQIKSIEIPYVWYTISAVQKNNSFLITLSDGSIKEITIPDGNYNTIPYQNGPIGLIPFPDIITFIQSQLTTKAPTIQCNYNPVKNKITFVASNNLNFKIDFTNEGLMTSSTGLSLGWIMGFKQDIYMDQHSYTTESTYKTSFNPYFFIDVDDFHNNHLTDAVISVVRTNKQGTPSYLGNNIIARIPITGAYNSMIVNTTSDCILKKRDYFGPVKLEKMNIRILDRFGEVIDLNYNDYSIVFEVTQLYS